MHDPTFPQWRKDVQAMPAESQVEAVCKKPVELNPKFDGKLVTDRSGNGGPKIEEGEVTEFGFYSNAVALSAAANSFDSFAIIFKRYLDVILMGIRHSNRGGRCVALAPCCKI
jgi:hypothetical protein